MSVQKKRYLIITLVAIAYFIGIYLDEFSDYIFSAIFSGLFQTQPGSIFNNYECLFIISKLIQKLQTVFVNINIYGVIIVAINSYCIYLMILLFIERMSFKENKFFKLILLSGVLLLLLHDFIFIQFTKTAIYCNFLGCYFLLNDKGKIKIALLLILLGVLLRTETFWFVFIFSSGICIIQKASLFILNLKKRKYIWLIVILSAALISYLNKQPYNDDDKRYEVFRTYKYSILDFKQKDSLHLVLSKQNYIKYYSLHQAFFGDTDSLINTAIFEQLNIKPHDRVDFKSFVKTFKYEHNIINAISNLSDLAYNNRANYIILLSVTFILIVLLFMLKEYKLLKKVLLILLLAFIYIFAITIYIKMEDRVLNPILLITLFYLLHNLPDLKPTNKRTYLLFVAVLLLAELFFISECYYKLRYRKSLHTQATSFIENWKLRQSDKILVPDLYSLQLFFTKAIMSTADIKKINLFSLDNGYMSMMKNHLEFNNKIAGSNHFKDYVLYIEKNKENVYFLGCEERMQMLENYIQSIYEIDIHFSKTNQSPEINANTPRGLLQFHLYKID